MPGSEHVVRILACYEDSAYFYTVFEACDGGDLFDFLSMLWADGMDTAAVEHEVRQVMGELLLSLHHLHSQGLVHKDVKLENLVFRTKGAVEPRSAKSPKASFLPSDKTSECKSPTDLKLIDFDPTDLKL